MEPNIRSARINDSEYIGKTFNSLTVIWIESPTGIKGKERLLHLKCVCGSDTTARFAEIRNGVKKSCGCQKNHYISIKNSTRNGLSKHPLQGVYNWMIKRCYDTSTAQFMDYGGRGITVCYEWRNDRYSFIKWALANGWKKGLQIDRKENDIGYSPDNCRFVTPMVNSNNRRNNIRIEYNGESKTLSEWCRGLKTSYKAAFYRYSVGYPVDVVLFGIKV